MTRYPTVRCRHCSLMRCFPGETSCWRWPGSLCPPDDAPIMSGDGLKYWDKDLGWCYV